MASAVAVMRANATDPVAVPSWPGAGALSDAPLPGLRAWVAIALLCLGAAAAVVYVPITKYPLYEPGLGGAAGDVGQYVRMEQGAPLDQIGRPFRYRIFTPLIARAVPLPPATLLRYFDMSEDKLILLRFGLVNGVGIAVAGTAMVAVSLALGFTLPEGLLAALLFFTALPVVNFDGAPMVDAWGHAFLALGLLAALRGSLVGLFVASLIGMTAKETTALLLPAVLLLSGTWRLRAWRVAAIVPGLAAYAYFRLVAHPGGVGFPADPQTSLENLGWRLQHGPYFMWLLWDGGSAFLALWPLAAIGLWNLRGRRDEPLARLAWLVPGIFLVPFVIGSNVGRIWFYAFPVMIPLALEGLRRTFAPLSRASVPESAEVRAYTRGTRAA
jgi:hypothetical protein